MARTVALFTRRTQIGHDLFEAPVGGSSIGHGDAAADTGPARECIDPRDYRFLREFAGVLTEAVRRLASALKA